MSPGTYLQKRRLAALPQAQRDVTRGDVDRLARHLVDAEADRISLSVGNAGLLARVYPLDVDVYARLQRRHHAGPFAGGLPEPQVCRSCACSFCDPCVTGRQPCGWVDGDPTLCTACAAQPAANQVDATVVALVAKPHRSAPTGAGL